MLRFLVESARHAMYCLLWVMMFSPVIAAAQFGVWYLLPFTPLIWWATWQVSRTFEV